MDGEPAGLFVYGTLKQGQRNSTLLAPYARAVEPATARGVLYDLGPFPALVAGEATVAGELARLDADELARLLPLLDRLEGYRPGDEADSLYVRRAIAVVTARGERVTAYAYFYNRPHAHLPRVTSGAWPGPSSQRLSGTDTELEAFARHVERFRDQQAR